MSPHGRTVARVASAVHSHFNMSLCRHVAVLMLLLVACSGSVHGAASNPWAGDPFADVAAPNEPEDASYPDPANDGGAVTWANWVSGFSNVYCVSCHNPQAPCAGSGCHVPSDPQVYALSFDMRERSSWTERAATIHCGIVVTQDPAWTCKVPPETYPKMVAGYPLPTDEARAAVADWIEAGCP